MSTGTRFPRIRFTGLAPEPGDETHARIQLNLTWDGRTYTTVFEPDTSVEEDLRAVADATIACLKQIATRAAFKVLDIQAMRVLSHEAVAVSIATQHEEGTEFAVGLCVNKIGRGDAAVRAVLNGTNRLMERLLHPG